MYIMQVCIRITTGQVFKALEFNTQDHGFESRHMLSVPRAPEQVLYPKYAAVHAAVNENLVIPRESYCTLITHGTL